MNLKAKLGLVAATALVVGAAGGYGVGSLAHRQKPQTEADQEEAIRETIRVVSLQNATLRAGYYSALLKGFRGGEQELMMQRLESLLDDSLADLARDYAPARDPYDTAAKVVRVAKDYRNQYPYRNPSTNRAQLVDAALAIKSNKAQ